MCRNGDHFAKHSSCGWNEWCIGPANAEEATDEKLCETGTCSYFPDFRITYSNIPFPTSVITLMIFLHTGSAYCDGSTLFFNCSSCPYTSDSTTGHGCNGNCEWNPNNNVCEVKGNRVLK